MHRQLLVPSLHQLVEYLLVHKHAVEASKIVEWEIDLDDLTQGPEGFLLVEAEEKIASDEIHALEVAYFWVALHKGVKQVNELFFFLFAVLCIRYLGIRANRVDLNLGKVRRRIIICKSLHCRIDARICLFLSQSA